MNSITIELGGKSRNFSLGLGFLGELIDSTGLTIDELMIKIQNNPFKYIPLTMYHSLSFSYEMEGKELDFTRFNVIKWIDDLPSGFNDVKVSNFISAFTKSLTKDVPVLENKEDQPKENKKKLIGSEM